MFCRYQNYQEQLVLFDSLSFQLLLERPNTIVPSSTSSTAGNDNYLENTNNKAGTTYNELPAYTPRHTHSIWNYTNSINPSNNSNGITNSIFYYRRRDVLTWITSIGYDVYDLPISDAALCKALLPYGSQNAEDICRVHRKSIEEDTGAVSIGSILEQVHLYGALQSLFKMHPMFDLAIYHILLRDPYAIILLSRNGKQTVWEKSFRTRLVTTITTLWNSDNTSAGSTPKTTLEALLNRVVFVNQMQHVSYEQLVCSMDVTLDTFPFGGGVTLSDGLGGCGAHMRNSCDSTVVDQNNNRTNNGRDKTVSQDMRCSNARYISPIVPFVTSGQLQSVHQIGAGIASKLGPNMRNYANSVPDMVLNFSVETPRTRDDNVRTEFYNSLYTPHLHYIREYAAAAVTTATDSHASKMYVKVNCDHMQNEVQKVERAINELLYDSSEAAQEWSDFMRRIAMI